MGQGQSRRAEAAVARAQVSEAIRDTAAEFEEACCTCEKGRFMSLALYRTAFWNYAFHKSAIHHSDRHKEQLSNLQTKTIHERAMAHTPATQGRAVSFSLNPVSGMYVLGMDLVRFPTAETIESCRTARASTA